MTAFTKYFYKIVLHSGRTLISLFIFLTYTSWFDGHLAIYGLLLIYDFVYEGLGSEQSSAVYIFFPAGLDWEKKPDPGILD